MEPSLEEVTVLPGRDVTVALDTMATRSTNQLTGTVITSIRVQLRTVTTYRPSQQIIEIPTRKQVCHGISTRPGERERQRETEK